MYSLLPVDKAEEAAQYSSEAMGDGKDAATHRRVCQSVPKTVNVCEEEGTLKGREGAIVCRSRLSVHASVLL